VKSDLVGRSVLVQNDAGILQHHARVLREEQVGALPRASDTITHQTRELVKKFGPAREIKNCWFDGLTSTMILKRGLPSLLIRFLTLERLTDSGLSRRTDSAGEVLSGGACMAQDGGTDKLGRESEGMLESTMRNTVDDEAFLSNRLRNSGRCLAPRRRSKANAPTGRL
jgi:hypothetical protein